MLTNHPTSLRVDIAGLAALLLVVLASSPAGALNTISLAPADQSVEIDSTFTVDVIMDFDDVTVGGGIEIAFDPRVTFVSFVFGPAFTGNFLMWGPEAGETVQPLEISIGWWITEEPFGELGLQTVGQLTFSADAAGTGQLITSSASAFTPGPFYGPVDPGTALTVQFGDSVINVSDPNGTPVPSLSPVLIGLLAVLLGSTGLYFRVQRGNA